MGGKMDKAKGKGEKALGDLTGDERMKQRGRLDEAGGKVKEAADKAVNRVKKAVNR